MAFGLRNQGSNHIGRRDEQYLQYLPGSHQDFGPEGCVEVGVQIAVRLQDADLRPDLVRQRQ